MRRWKLILAYIYRVIARIKVNPIHENTLLRNYPFCTLSKSFIYWVSYDEFSLVLMLFFKEDYKSERRQL